MKRDAMQPRRMDKPIVYHLIFSDTLTETLVLESRRKKISSIWTRVAYFTHVSVIRQEKRMAPHFLGDVQIIREEIRST